MPSPAVGNKSALVSRAALRGALGGLMWSTLAAGGCHAYIEYNGGSPRGDYIPSIYLGTILTWTAIAAGASAARARDSAMTEAARRAVSDEVRRTVRKAWWFALPVALLYVVVGWGEMTALVIANAVIFVTMWLGIAALIGRAAGSAAAKRIEETALLAARNAEAGGRAARTRRAGLRRFVSGSTRQARPSRAAPGGSAARGGRGLTFPLRSDRPRRRVSNHACPISARSERGSYFAALMSSVIATSGSILPLP